MFPLRNSHFSCGLADTVFFIVTYLDGQLCNLLRGSLFQLPKSFFPSRKKSTLGAKKSTLIFTIVPDVFRFDLFCFPVDQTRNSCFPVWTYFCFPVGPSSNFCFPVFSGFDIITAIPRNKPPPGCRSMLFVAINPPLVAGCAETRGGLWLEWPKSPNFQILLRIYTCEKFSPLRGKMATKPGGFVAKGGGCCVELQWCQVFLCDQTRRRV